MNKGVFFIILIFFFIVPILVSADACYCKSGDCFDDCSDKCQDFCESFGSVMQDCIPGESCYTEPSVASEFSALAAILLIFFISGGYVVYKRKHKHKYHSGYV
ncbi:hypothetical protein KY312_02675 [Candidatus Woesearchaeota archaeon]|nr:hypothetical protein [Candidatus Woesearchaeota archaeon]